MKKFNDYLQIIQEGGNIPSLSEMSLANPIKLNKIIDTMIKKKEYTKSEIIDLISNNQELWEYLKTTLIKMVK
jgi:hypothetical protein